MGKNIRGVGELDWEHLRDEWNHDKVNAKENGDGTFDIYLEVVQPFFPYQTGVSWKKQMAENDLSFLHQEATYSPTGFVTGLHYGRGDRVTADKIQLPFQFQDIAAKLAKKLNCNVKVEWKRSFVILLTFHSYPFEVRKPEYFLTSIATKIACLYRQQSQQ